MSKKIVNLVDIDCISKLISNFEPINFSEKSGYFVHSSLNPIIDKLNHLSLTLKAQAHNELVIQINAAPYLLNDDQINYEQQTKNKTSRRRNWFRFINIKRNP